MDIKSNKVYTNYHKDAGFLMQCLVFVCILLFYVILLCIFYSFKDNFFPSYFRLYSLFSVFNIHTHTPSYGDSGTVTHSAVMDHETIFIQTHTHTYTIKNARIYAYTKTLTSVHIRILKQLRFISCSFCLRKMLQCCFNRFKKELQRSSCITQWGKYLYFAMQILA